MNQGFRSFPQRTAGSWRNITQLDHGHFLLNSFQFITHQLCQNITLSIVSTNMAIEYNTKKSNIPFYRNHVHVLDSQFYTSFRSKIHISRNALYFHTLPHIRTQTKRKNYRGMAHINVQDEM